MVERGGRFEYLYGHGHEINESPQDKMLRMLTVQHPPEVTPQQFQPGAFPQRQLMDVLESRIESPQLKGKKHQR